MGRYCYYYVNDKLYRSNTNGLETYNIPDSSLGIAYFITADEIVELSNIGIRVNAAYERLREGAYLITLHTTSTCPPNIYNIDTRTHFEYRRNILTSTKYGDDDWIINEFWNRRGTGDHYIAYDQWQKYADKWLELIGP